MPKFIIILSILLLVLSYICQYLSIFNFYENIKYYMEKWNDKPYNYFSANIKLKLSTYVLLAFIVIISFWEFEIFGFNSLQVVSTLFKLNCILNIPFSLICSVLLIKYKKTGNKNYYRGKLIKDMNIEAYGSVILSFFCSILFLPNDEISVSFEDINYIPQYLDECKLVNSDYSSISLDESFVLPIRLNDNINLEVDSAKPEYTHGIECLVNRLDLEPGTHILNSKYAYSTFYLGRHYNTLTGECKILNNSSTDNFDLTLEFLCDDKLVKSYYIRAEEDFWKIDIDVNKCKNLTVKIVDNNYESNNSTRLVLENMILIQ